MTLLKTVLFITVGAYLLLTGVVYFFQEWLIFLGQPIPKDHTYSFDVPFEERNYEMSDGAQINALLFSAEDPKGVIFYHHGNGGELPRWGQVSYFFVEQGYDVLMYDYRGYGKSTGERTEANLLSDAQSLYEELLKEYAESDLIVYGRSLGSGPGSFVAGKNNPRLLILETPFFSLEEMASRRFPFLPTRQLLRYRFENAKFLDKAKVAVHIFHGTEDRVVPYESGQRLHQALDPSHAAFYTIAGANHHNLLEHEAYRDRVAGILSSLVSSD